jgi:hypothetical protein
VNDCVYEALARHLEYLGLSATDEDRLCHRYWKWMLHDDADVPCWGGVVPYLARKITKAHGLVVALEHDVWTPDHYAATAGNMALALVSKSCWRGASRGITLRPAVYLVLDSQHAVFAETVPPGLVVGAVQLRRRQ